MSYQLDLIGMSPDEALAMCQKLEASLGNLRRGIFQRHNDLLQMYLQGEDKGKEHDKRLADLEESLAQLRSDIASLCEQTSRLASTVEQLRCIVQYPSIDRKAERLGKVIVF